MVESSDLTIDKINVSAYQVPTEGLESDGTLEWESTTMVFVEAWGGGERGIGYTYNHVTAARLIEDYLARVVEGSRAMAVKANWQAMYHAIRNIGRPGLVASAIAAVDTALWDLKARLLDVPLVMLLDAVHERVPVYRPARPAPRRGAAPGPAPEWRGPGLPRAVLRAGPALLDSPQRVGEQRAIAG